MNEYNLPLFIRTESIKWVKVIVVGQSVIKLRTIRRTIMMRQLLSAFGSRALCRFSLRFVLTLILSHHFHIIFKCTFVNCSQFRNLNANVLRLENACFFYLNLVQFMWGNIKKICFYYGCDSECKQQAVVRLKPDLNWWYIHAHIQTQFEILRQRHYHRILCIQLHKCRNIKPESRYKCVFLIQNNDFFKTSMNFLENTKKIRLFTRNLEAILWFKCNNGSLKSGAVIASVKTDKFDISNVDHAFMFWNRNIRIWVKSFCEIQVKFTWTNEKLFCLLMKILQ